MEIRTRNVNTAFYEVVVGLWRGMDHKVGRGGDDIAIPTRCENTRNGKVWRVTEPLLITYERPTERVLFNAARDANPFFHLYEALFMLAGRNDLAPLAYYNPKMAEFSDDGKTLNGAYGHRWRHAKVHDEWNWPHQEKIIDQLAVLIDHLKRNPQSRRAVLAMWNVEDDLLKIDTSKDVCCNLNVVFDVRDLENNDTTDFPTKPCRNCGRKDRPQYKGSCNDGHCDEFGPTPWRALDMTVTNRSNDLVWGTLGANAVHFSVLQEYVAACLGVEVGVYHQFSTNAHVYEWNWKPEEWLADKAYPLPEGPYYKIFPLVKYPATFDKECAEYVEWAYNIERHDSGPTFSEPFLQDVALPMSMAFHQHKCWRDYVSAKRWIAAIKADDWRIAARSWIIKREANWESKSAADRRSTLQDAD